MGESRRAAEGSGRDRHDLYLAESLETHASSFARSDVLIITCKHWCTQTVPRLLAVAENVHSY